MSWLALDWAETVPVADVYERGILTQMAARANKDGTGAYLSARTLARRLLCDEKTIERRFRKLRERGVMVFGDQALAAHIPKNRRPKVYDLMIPATSYSAKQLADVNLERAEHGFGPITKQNRPDLAEPPPSRKTRSDLGVPRKPTEEEFDEVQPLTWDDTQRGLAVPPEESAEGSTSPLQGGLQVPARGVYKTDKTVLGNPSLETGEGGPVTGERHLREGTPAANAPPPPKVDLDDRATWLCREHLPLASDPGSDRPPCAKCARVREWAQERLAQRDRELAAQACDEAELARRCPWHDQAGWVLDPDGDDVLKPAVKCDHRRHPSEIKAELSEARRDHVESSSAEKRQRLRESWRKPGSRPVPAQRSGGGQREPVDDAHEAQLTETNA